MTQACPVCNGDGQVYRMTASYQSVVASAAGGSFGWTGPTHEWRTCKPCAGTGLLSSQPASEPSLDVERLAPDPKQSSEYHRGWRAAMMAAAPSLDVDRLFAAWPDDVSPRRGKYVISIGTFLEELAAEYQRLSQPADNEAAATPESRTE